MEVENIKPVLKYPGAKWNLAEWIISFLPQHTTYLEPYFGSGAVFFNKQPSSVETINDINSDVVSLFKILRDRPEELAELIELTPWARDEYYSSCIKTGDELEDARRFITRCWQAFGARIDARSGWRHEKKGTMRASTYHTWLTLHKRIMATAGRLRECQIENKPAVELIKSYNYDTCLIYADPPYMLETRGTKLYPHEMTTDDHLEMLIALDQHPGPVILSGYDCSLYNDGLKHWKKETRKAQAEKGQSRTEVLWINPTAVNRIEGRLFE